MWSCTLICFCHSFHTLYIAYGADQNVSGSVYFVNDDENDDENDENILNYRRQD